MLERHMRYLHAPADASGTPPPSSAPGAPPPAPGAPPPAASPDSESPAWAKALAGEVADLKGAVADLKGAKAKLEADKNAEAAAKLNAEQKAELAIAENAKLRADLTVERIDRDVAAALNAFSFPSPKHHAAALGNFRDAYKFEVKDGTVLAISKGDGKPQHLAVAAAAWAKEDGTLFITSSAQPGAPGLPGSIPQAPATVKRPRDMSDEEFATAWKNGKLADGTPIKGALTPGGPVFEFKSEVNPYAAKRASINAAFRDLARARRGAPGASNQ